tara:strand:- start:325 stop:765 length:441 start_codon:yes stop_codon:yes gene_type:complete
VTPSFDLVPIKVKNGFVVGRVYVRMVRAGIRTYYNIYDYKKKKNVMLNVFYKNSAIAIAEAHNLDSNNINQLKYMEEEYSNNYIEMTHFRYLYHRTQDDDKKQVYETRFDDYQQRCISIRNKIDNFICDPANKFQCAEVINKANED